MNVFCEPCRTIFSSGYGTTATEFVILTDKMYNLCNHKGFKLILCQKLPSVATALPVFIQINGVNYPLLDKFGNTFRVDELKTRCPYRIVFGTDPVHFIAIDVCCVSINHGADPVVATAAITPTATSATTPTTMSKKTAVSTAVAISPAATDLANTSKEVK